MSKRTNSILNFQDQAMSKTDQQNIKGGGLSKSEKKIQKILEKYQKAMRKNDHKEMGKYGDELDCLGISLLSCCGNGIGVW